MNSNNLLQKLVNQTKEVNTSNRQLVEEVTERRTRIGIIFEAIKLILDGRNIGNP